LPKSATVFLGCATGKENASAIDFLWQLGKDRAQTLGRGEAKIRGRQFSVLQNAKFPTEVTVLGYGFYQHPGGFRSAAFDPENAFTGFHDWVCITAFPEN
jgi:hypothetical protein